MDEEEVAFLDVVGHAREWLQLQGVALVAIAGEIIDQVVRMMSKSPHPLPQHLAQNGGMMSGESFPRAFQHKQLRALNIDLDHIGRWDREFVDCGHRGWDGECGAESILLKRLEGCGAGFFFGYIEILNARMV